MESPRYGVLGELCISKSATYRHVIYVLKRLHTLPAAGLDRHHMIMASQTLWDLYFNLNFFMASHKVFSGLPCRESSLVTHCLCLWSTGLSLYDFPHSYIFHACPNSNTWTMQTCFVASSNAACLHGSITAGVFMCLQGWPWGIRPFNSHSIAGH